MTESTRRRVVITGIGVICSIGKSTEEFWQNCLKGYSAVSPIPAHWHQYADYKSTIWAPLSQIDYAGHSLTRGERLQHDPVSLLAICTAQEAVQNAHLSRSLNNRRSNTYSIEGLDPARAGVFMGTGIGGIETCLESNAYQILARAKRNLSELSTLARLEPAQASVVDDTAQAMVHPRRFSPLAVPMLMANAVSAVLGIKFSITGPNTTYVLACAAGTAAIGHAFHAIRSGQIDLALSGGCEYLDDYYGSIFRAYDVANTLVQNCDEPEKANRPFDRKRSGFLFSQGGAAVLVMEELDSALERGAPLIAEVVGFAETFDAHSMMSIAADGVQIERMIRLALDDAKIRSTDVHYVNAHGTGTQVNDVTESKVVERVFGRDVLVNSTKSLVGHTIGASGALEASVTALSLKHQTTHICKNLEQPIAELNFVCSVASHQIDAAISQSFAFGGHNAGLVLQRLRT